MLDSLKNGLRDAADVLKHARPAELVKALVPTRVRGLKVLNAGGELARDPTLMAQPEVGERRESSPVRRGPRNRGDVSSRVGVRTKRVNRRAGDARGSTSSSLAQRLRDLRGALSAEAVREDGSVSYQALRGSATYRELVSTAELLAHAPIASLSSDGDKTAFWVNLYNVLAIHGVIALGIERSVMEIPSFFSWVAYQVGPFRLTLDDIENGVLRANRPHPVSRSPLFAAGDPRLALAPTVVDPRIHAALVCASASCPAVRFYEASQLDAQLDMAARAYVAAGVHVDDAARVVQLPITFRYYAVDFEPGGVKAFVARHAQPEHAARLRQAFAESYAITYARYDWSLNAPR